jgi:hypothetical protein
MLRKKKITTDDRLSVKKELESLKAELAYSNERADQVLEKLRRKNRTEPHLKIVKPAR